jgi:plastocyanin
MKRALQLILLTLSVTSCTDAIGNADVPDDRDTIALGLTSFNPSTTTVPKGTTVKWVNTSSASHTITPDQPNQAGVWSSTIITGFSQSFTHTFNTSGTYNYHCSLHAGMNGTIIVE